VSDLNRENSAPSKSNNNVTFFKSDGDKSRRESTAEFTVNGDEIFCREGYTDAEGVLTHLDNVGALLTELLTMADLTRVEVHGPATELEKLKKPTSIRRGSRLHKASPHD
jgi:hypothetical protein